MSWNKISSVEEAKKLWNTLFEYGGIEDDLYFDILEEFNIITIDEETGDIVDIEYDAEGKASTDAWPSPDELFDMIAEVIRNDISS